MYGRRTCGTRKHFLRVTKQVGYVPENVTHVELENATSAGVRWGSLASDMVPLFEEHLARLEKNYKMDEWYKIDRMERAMVVAVRRVDIATKNHQTEAEIKNATKKAGRK